MFKKPFYLFFRESLSRNFFLFSVLFFIFFLWIGLISYWSHSEIYPAHSAKNLFSPDRLNYLFSLKLGYNFLLYISYKISEIFSLYPMDIARVLFSINGFSLLMLMTLFIQRKSNNYNAILAALIFMGSFIFLERGYRVRSDILVSTLNLCSLFLANYWLHSKNYRRLLVVFFLFFGVLIVSPKSIYWVIFSSSLLFYELKKYKFSRLIYLKYIGIVFAFFLILSFLFQDPLFLKALKASMSYYLLNIRDSLLFLQNKGILNLFSKFSYISLFIQKNLFLFFLILLKIGFLIYSLLLKRERKWSSVDTSFILLVLVFLLHPQQKPFFVCALMPYFLIFFFIDTTWLELQSKYSQKFKLFLLLGAYIYVSLFATYNGYRFLKYNNNFLQKKTMKKLNAFFKHRPSVKVYDPNALLYNSESYNWYIESKSSKERVFNEYLRKYKVDVILSSVYMDSLQVFKWEDKSFKFTTIGHHIYYKSLIVDLQNKKKFYGGDLFLNLEKEEEDFLNKSTQKYWYIFLNAHKSPISSVVDIKSCKKDKGVKNLQSGCLYTKEELLKGWIVPKDERAAFVGVFYIEPLKDLKSEVFLRQLYRYDFYIRLPNLFSLFKGVYDEKRTFKRP